MRRNVQQVEQDVPQMNVCREFEASKVSYSLRYEVKH